MKRSLTKQIMAIIISLVVGTIVVCFLLNTSFLGTFYTMQKKNLLMESYETIQNASDEGSLYSSEFDQEFDKLCSNQNLSIIIMSADGTPMRSSVNDIRLIQKQFLNVIFGTTTGDRVMARTDHYILEHVQDADMNNEDYLVLWGTLDDGNLILMRTAMDGIRESSKIANQFLLYVGSCAIAGSVLLSILISRRITKPIVQLSEISQKMVDLDFNAKYVRGGWKKNCKGSLPKPSQIEKMENGNEIDQLGLHMNQLSDQLERTISELKTANNELMRDIEKKEQIDEMRKEFLSNVSHELKTPLALIQGYAEGLQACINDDAESRNFYCEVIMDEADKMNKMVKKLLTLNQLEFGNDQVYMERFNITELIQGVVNSSSLLLEQKGITVEMDLPEEYVWADEFKVEEVITNYLSNAMNHTEGEKKIRIFYEKKDTCLRISVFNTGKPIPEEDIDNIWIKFYNVDKARTRAYGGSGIGLSIVKAIMDSFHQECGVINHEDGVEFWLELGL